MWEKFLSGNFSLNQFGKQRERILPAQVTSLRRNDSRDALLHDDQRGFEAFIARHNRYSTLEAAARFKAERGAPDRARLPSSLLASPVQRKRFLRERIWPAVPAKPLMLFAYMYVLRRGFLDGRAGLTLSVFHAFQEFMVGLKLAELRRLSSRTVSRG